jgi:hypothetical protein
MQLVMTITCLKMSRGARQVSNVLEQLIWIVLLGFLTNRLSVIIYTGAKDKTEDDDDDADSVLGGESQVMLNIYENADVYVDEEEPTEAAETSGLSAQRPEPTREKTAAGERGFNAVGVPAQGHVAATENMVRPKSERVSPAALFVDLTVSPEKSEPVVHLEDAKLPVVAGASDNIQSRAVGISEAQLPTAALATASVFKQDDAKLPGVTGARGNIQPGAAGSSEAQQPTAAMAAASACKQDDAKLPDVTGARGNIQARASDSSQAQQPTRVVAAAYKQDEGIVSNLPPEEKEMPFVAAAGARKESTSPRNVTLVGKTTNEIRCGKNKTTFSAFDLPLPAGAKRKKPKKKRKS